MKPDLLLLVKACQEILKIKMPVVLKIKTHATGKMKTVAGYCDNYYRKDKLVGHKVVIHLDTVYTSGYCIYDVIAHELIHASMIENDLFNPDYHHDEVFQNMAGLLKTYLNNCGFKIESLYDSKIDTD